MLRKNFPHRKKQRQEEAKARQEASQGKKAEKAQEVKK